MGSCATAQSNINLAILSEVAVGLPPVDEQHEIVRRVQDLFLKCDAVEATLNSAVGRVDLLSQAALAKAFRGELFGQMAG